MTAISTPIVGVLAVAAATYVGIRNWRTSRDKLKLELFDKRWVFREAIETLVKKMLTYSLNGVDYQVYRQAVSASYWLFDKDLHDYVEGELENHITQFRDNQDHLEDEGDPVKRRELILIQQNELHWMVFDNEANLNRLFEKYLRLRH
jgi:hypothetical protein